MVIKFLLKNAWGGGGVLPVKGYWGCTAGWGRIFTTGLTIKGVAFCSRVTRMEKGVAHFRDFPVREFIYQVLTYVIASSPELLLLVTMTQTMRGYDRTVGKIEQWIRRDRWDSRTYGTVGQRDTWGCETDGTAGKIGQWDTWDSRTDGIVGQMGQMGQWESRTNGTDGTVGHMGQRVRWDSGTD